MRQIPIRFATCRKCHCKFEWLPRAYNSTKGEDAFPRCPDCGGYRATVDKGLHNRPDETEAGFWK